MALENKEKKYKFLIKRLDILSQTEKESYQSLDKTLLALTSGAITLSITFIKDVYVVGCKEGLFISWFLWTISLFLQLGAHFLSAKAIREEQNILINSYENDVDHLRQNPYTDYISIINLLAIVIFAIGTVAFLYFVSNVV